MITIFFSSFGDFIRRACRRRVTAYRGGAEVVVQGGSAGRSATTRALRCPHNRCKQQRREKTKQESRIAFVIYNIFKSEKNYNNIAAEDICLINLLVSVAGLEISPLYLFPSILGYRMNSSKQRMSFSACTSFLHEVVGVGYHHITTRVSSDARQNISYVLSRSSRWGVPPAAVSTHKGLFTTSDGVNMYCHLDLPAPSLFGEVEWQVLCVEAHTK